MPSPKNKNSTSNQHTRQYVPASKSNGFTLIETLSGIVILALISLTLYSLITFTLKVIWESKSKVTATQLANQKLEMARNLNYQDVGTSSGIPSGIIPATEVITRNGIDYTVTTDVIYIDDPYDNKPDDLINTDYKKVRVEVSWNYRYQHQPVVLITNISPLGLESTIGGGTLKILVYDAYGVPVPQADVTIVNTDIEPNININTQTDNQGYVILPGSPESTEGYQITVTKTGFSTDQTYSSTPELPSPEKPRASVFEAQTTNISFSIDQLSNLNLTLQNKNGIGLSNTELNIRGDKTIGFDADEQMVYKYNQNHISNFIGHIILNNLEWDSYTFSMPETAVYNISETVPIQPYNLLPNTTTDIIITLVPKAEHSVLVIVKDINNQPLSDAQVHLYNYSQGLDQTLITSDSGQIFFTPWQNVTSTLDVILTGYQNYSDEFKVDGYYVEEVTLTTP